MRMHLLIGASAALAIGMISASGSQRAFAANPTRETDGLNPNSNDAGLLGIAHDIGMSIDGAGGDQHLHLKVNGIDTGDDTGDDAIGDSGTNVDYGLAAMAVASDDRAPCISGTDGHMKGAADLGIDTDDDSPPAFIAAATLANTVMSTDAGVFASG